MLQRSLWALGVSAVVAAVILAWRERRKEASASALADPGWSLTALLVASFLTLFTELAFIRWIAVEVRVFAYFNNLVLLVCFLGFGMGCALANEKLRMKQGLAGLMAALLVVRLPLAGWSGRLESLSETLGRTPGLEIWQTGSPHPWTEFLIAALIAGVLLYFMASAFIPLGQIVSRQLNLASAPLRAYSWNLAGSLAGILVFVLLCWRMLSPGLWFAIVLAGFALLQRQRRQGLIVALLILPALALVHSPNSPGRFSLWTPYQQVAVERALFPDGELKGYSLFVNHASYQAIADLAPDFLRRHPELSRGPAEDNSVNIPFQFAGPHPRVLILGAGTGNDAAAALRYGSSHVDAVEIDPGIWQIGERLHMEHPYQSPLVEHEVTDARAFLRRATGRYDLILYAALDSHILFSNYSNMRIDNFVYTKQSFEESRRLLARDGLLFVKFEVDQPWMGKRIEEVLRQAFGKEPLVFQIPYLPYPPGGPTGCFVISNSGAVDRALAEQPELARFVSQNPAAFVNTQAVPITTDDWPYLYQQWKMIPRTYITLGILLMLLAAVFYFEIPGSHRTVPSLFYFAMGAGFMLLETQVISRLALYFGATWQVNAFVIAAILIALLAANVVAENLSSRFTRAWLFAGILGGLALAFLLPLENLSGSANLLGVLAAIKYSIPVFFAGVLFAREFRSESSPGSALGANMLGAATGGLLQNVSLIAGMHLLLLIAMGVYALAAWGVKTERVGASAARSLFRRGVETTSR
jgi:SAM-dependent methyltransferase